MAEIAQAEAELAAEAAEYATQVAAEQVQAAAEKAAVEAHHAAVEATYAAERAAHKAEFIATAMAEGVSREDAERLAAEAGTKRFDLRGPERSARTAQDVSQGLLAGMRCQPTSPSSITVVGICRSR